MNKLVFITLDQQKIEVDPRFEQMSQLISDIPDLFEEIPITIESEIFKKVLEFSVMNCFKHPQINKPIKSDKLIQNLDTLNYNFIKNYDLETIKPLINAAIYLNVPSLLDVCIVRIATEFYFEKTLEGINKLKNKYNFQESDLDEETQNNIRNEFSWAFQMPETIQYNNNNQN